MPDNYLWHSRPSTLWVMAAAEVAPGGGTRGSGHVATPLSVAVTAAGLVSGIRFGSDAVRRANPQVAQWDAIRSHYQEVADWIDLDAPIAHLDRMSSTAWADYLGLLACSDDVVRWMSSKPAYWVTAGESVDTAATALPEFRRDYEYATTIGPLNIYRRTADSL